MAEKPTYEELELRVKELEMDLRDGKQAEKTLRETQNIKQLLKFAPFGVYLIDLSGKIVACNESGAERLGKTIETSIGTVLRDYFPVKVSENRRRKGMEAIQSRQAVTFEDQAEGRWYRNSIFPIFDDEGRPVRLAIYGADITEYMNALDLLEKGEERYRQLADLLPQVVFETDEKGNLTFTNQMAFDLFGYTRADFEKGLTAIQMLIPEDRERAVRNMQTALSGEKLGGSEYTARTKDGRTFPVMIYSHPIMKEGKAAGLRGIMVDITEATRDREALHREKEKFRVLVEESPLGISLIGKDGRYEYINPRFTEIFGYHLEDIPTGREWFRKAYPDQEYRRQVIRVWINDQKEAEVGEARPRTYVATCKDGSEKTINFRPVMLETGEQVVICDDITEEKRAEAALRKSEEKYRNIFDNAQVGIFRTRINDGKVLECNDRFARTYGYESPKACIADFVTSERYTDPGARQKMVAAIMEKGEIHDIEACFSRKNGDTVWVRFSARAYPEEGYLEGVGYDITEEKKALDGLRESEERYRKLIEASNDGIAIIRDDMHLYVNQRFLDIFGYDTPQEVLGKSFFVSVHPDDLERVTDLASRRQSGDPVPSRYEFKGRRKNGQTVFIEVSAAKTIYKGEPVSLAYLRDVTERRQVQEALRESEGRFRDISYSMADWIWEVDKYGRYTFATETVKQILGYDPQELMGKSPFELMPEDEARRMEGVFKTIVSEKKPIVDLENWNLSKDGRKVCLQTNGVPMLDEKGELIGYRGVDKDITERKLAEEERKKLEAQLQQAHKMEAMGLLAGGVAHDLNNILSGIVSYPELLLMDLPEDSPLRKPIKTIKESGMRAADVVADLLTIARGVATGKEALNLNAIVSEYLGSAEFDKLKKTHSFVDFRTDLDSDLLNISGSSIHIKKALMNLVVNATEAIEGSGAVIISTGNRYLDEPVGGYEDVKQGEYAVLGVSDNGSGISPEDLERIFEPFYTKKIMGRSGTGLGLAVVWNTVQDHHGYIRVESREKGTAFELYFPVTREETADEKEPVDLQDYLGHGEKILVVDDEERQREIACGMLTKLGYNPQAVSSGEEAIEHVKEHPVDLIVLDMIMPKGINGRETYEEIIRTRPGQKAVIASGFAKTREVDAAQDLGAGEYIKKPYMLEKIGIAVKRELEK